MKDNRYFYLIIALGFCFPQFLFAIGKRNMNITGLNIIGS